MEKARYDRVPYTDEQLKLFFHPFVLLDAQNKITLHWHEHIELAYFVEGEALVRHAGGETVAHTGDLIVINAGEFHSYQHSGDKKAVYHSFVLKESFFDGLEPDFFSMRFHPLIKGDLAVKAMLDFVVDELISKNIYYRNTVRHLLIVLLVFMARKYALTDSPAPLRASVVDSHIRKILQYVRNNFSNTITLSDVSKHVGYSNDYVSRTFAKFTGQTLMSFINEYRCRKARSYLMSKQYNVTEAMTACGFSSFSYFSKTYKELFGVTPSEDLKKSRKTEG